MKFKTLLWAVFVTAALGLASCSTSEKAISYKEALRYFVKNDVKEYVPRIITSNEELNRYFGTAAVMGVQGMPTFIDFDKYNAIAIIEPATNKDVDVNIESIKKQGDKILVRYKLVGSGEQRSYTTVPCQLVRISKKYGDKVEFVKD